MNDLGHKARPRPAATSRPRVFVASAAESLDIAYAVQQNLERDAELTVWDQGIFEPSRFALESLIEAVKHFDFGSFIFSADDIVKLRGRKYAVARDNVVFELGLFVGGIGRERTFLLVPRGRSDLRLPTDLLGLNSATFDPGRTDGNLQAALGPACHQIRGIIRGLGPISRRVGDDPTRSIREPSILFVDDDLPSDGPMAKRLRVLFAGRAPLAFVTDPNEAADLLARPANLLGCVTDMVFREDSEVAGVRVAQAAMRSGVPVLVVSGHDRAHLGLALEELRRIGIPDERVLTKPLTPEQHRQFVEDVGRLILGTGG